MVFRTDTDELVTREIFSRRRRRLGDRKKRRENGSDNIAVASRTILLMWAGLVSVGFLSAFVSIVNPTSDFNVFAFSQASEIHCVPENGTLDLSTRNNYYHWGQFFITSDFLDANNCIDPCPTSPTMSGNLWFRDYSDLQSFDEIELVNIFGFSGQLSLILSYANQWSWIFIYVFLQGIWAVCLGRSQPFVARLRIYGFITHLCYLFAKKDAPLTSWQVVVAKVIAFMAYLGAVGIAVISVPLLVLNITLIELYIQYLPQSETPKHVGAWSPYAVIGLGLFSFFVANFQIKYLIKGFWAVLLNILRSATSCLRPRKREPKKGYFEACKRALQKAWFLIHANLMDYIVEQRNDALIYYTTNGRKRRISGRTQTENLRNTKSETRKLEKKLLWCHRNRSRGR
jgi:hypothetical protein